MSKRISFFEYNKLRRAAPNSRRSEYRRWYRVRAWKKIDDINDWLFMNKDRMFFYFLF
jgi:hypothetical protein